MSDKFDDALERAKEEAGKTFRMLKDSWDKNVKPGLDDTIEKAKPVAKKAKDKAVEIYHDPAVQDAKDKAVSAGAYMGDKLDEWANKATPYMEQIGQAMEDLFHDFRSGKQPEGEPPREEKAQSEGDLDAACDRIKRDIDDSELSEETKLSLGTALKAIVDEFQKGMHRVEASGDKAKELEELRVATFGKNCELSVMLRSIGQYPAQDRKAIGQVVNKTRAGLETIFDSVKQEADKAAGEQALIAEKLDVTLPGKEVPIGTIHPLSRVFEELCEIFIGMGFSLKDGPEVELDEYSFDMLNLPKDHPARDMQDTFYIEENEVVLRPHTSPVQIRTMLQEKPPIRILSPGRVYRSDDIDATHSPIFHQMEGLVVDKGITMAHLKYVLDHLASELFGDEIKVRLRPSYFPFTEPSAEVDLTCVACKGEGCSVCKGTGWIEVLGCGMVHPNVLRNCGIDPEEYSGFAFGMGLERIANLKYKSNDIRLMYENDVRFLKQF